MTAVTIDQYNHEDDGDGTIANDASVTLTPSTTPANNNFLLALGQCGSGGTYGFGWAKVSVDDDGTGPEASDGYTVVDGEQTRAGGVGYDPGSSMLAMSLTWKNSTGAAESPTWTNGGHSGNADEFSGFYVEVSGFAGATATKFFNTWAGSTGGSPCTFNNITGLDNAKTYSVITFTCVDGQKTITLDSNYSDTNLTNGTVQDGGASNNNCSTRIGIRTGVSPSGGAIAIGDSTYSGGGNGWGTIAVAIEESSGAAAGQPTIRRWGGIPGMTPGPMQSARGW